jgi:hypothetical protein
VAGLHVLQADTRPFVVHGESRRLEYDVHTDTEARMREVNGGTLVRAWDHWALSVVVNRLKCEAIGCAHHVIPIRPEDHDGRHVTWGKIRVLQRFMHEHPEAQIVAALDSDAFIRDEEAFLALARALEQAPDRHGALSREPLMPKNTYINTGCLVLKNTGFSRMFLDAVWRDVDVRPQYRLEWPHEQHAASAFVRRRRESFFVCRTAVLNTPCGEIVRHAWWKEQFAELVEEELKAAVAKRVCPDLLCTEPRLPFDLAALLDDEAEGLARDPVGV